MNTEILRNTEKCRRIQRYQAGFWEECEQYEEKAGRSIQRRVDCKNVTVAHIRISLNIELNTEH